MQLHQIKPKNIHKKRKRVGRGGKRGTYSGRGVKGQKSRASKHMEPMIRGVIKRYPKLRGYRFLAKDNLLVAVNLYLIERNFKEGDLVSPKSLLGKTIIRKIKGRVPGVKILSKGELTKSLSFKGCQFSKGAESKIEKAKGKIL